MYVDVAILLEWFNFAIEFVPKAMRLVFLQPNLAFIL